MIRSPTCTAPRDLSLFTSTCVRTWRRAPFTCERKVYISAIALDSILVTGTGTAALLGTGLSVAYLAEGIYKADRSDDKVTSPEMDEGMVWSVATVVSLVPYINWMAWIMPALNSEASEKRRWQFFGFAALYAVPALLKAAHFEGPDISFLALYALCAAQVQVELTTATNIVAARERVHALPDDGKQILRIGEASSRRLGSFTEALSYTVSREGKQAELPTLKEKVAAQEDEEARQRLEELEARSWEDRLKARKGE